MCAGRIAESELQTYISEKLVPVDNDPLLFWKLRGKEFPHLAKLALRYLSAPIGSVPSEREFKVASDIASDERCRLLPKNIEMLLFLKYNLRAVNYDTFSLPKPKQEDNAHAERQQESEFEEDSGSE